MLSLFPRSNLLRLAMMTIAGVGGEGLEFEGWGVGSEGYHS